MATSAQEKAESAKKNLEAVKSSIGDTPKTPEERVKLRKAAKSLRRSQRRAALDKTKQGKIETQEASRLKNIQKAEESVAKKKAAEESALKAAAEKQAEAQAAAKAAEEAAKAEAEAAKAAENSGDTAAEEKTEETSE